MRRSGNHSWDLALDLSSLANGTKGWAPQVTAGNEQGGGWVRVHGGRWNSRLEVPNGRG